MSKISIPNVPYVEARYQGGKQKPTLLIIRSTETTSEKGAALGIANYSHRASAPPDSCHYVVDSDDLYQCVPDNVVANGTPKKAITIKVCSELMTEVDLWFEEISNQALSNTADLVARLLLIHKIPAYYAHKPRWTKFKARHRGGVFVDMRGDWPYLIFMQEVRKRMDQIRLNET